MNKIVIALAIVVVGAAGPAVASPETDVMGRVQQFTNAFNKGDLKMAQAACASQVSIIDDFSPHEWHGAEATSAWFDGYNAYAKKNGITNAVVTLGKPRHVDITGGHAYVVVPTGLAMNKNGKTVKETGLWTLVLHKEANGWRISAWTWADE